MNENRTQLHEIESQILAITGTDTLRYNHWADNIETRDKVETLLKRRCDLLNDMFIPSPENMARFRQVNGHLYKLTCLADKRIGDINATEYYMASQDDDDQEVEGWVRFVFNDEDSVLLLDDDEYYESNFTLMIKALDELYSAKHQDKIIHADMSGIKLDDGESWMDVPFWCWEEAFKDIIICYAVHDLTNHKAYSVPDLLRLNDFWTEARITFQSITRQDGTRPLLEHRK